MARDAQEHADGRERRGQRGPAVAEKWQWHAGDRQGVGDCGHVEQGLESHPRADRGGQGHAEPVGSPERSAVAAHAENQEAQHHQARAHQPRFLADDREDEVGVGLWQPAVLLDRMSDADAEEAARGETVERLRGLESGAERVRPWIPERGEAPQSVRLEQRHRDEAEAEDRKQQDDVTQASAAGPVGTDEDAHHHDRGAEVSLQHQKDEYAGQHGGERDEDLLELAHPLCVAVDPVRDEDGEGELAQLGWLKRAERSCVEPPPRAVDGHAQVWDEDQDHQQRRGPGSGGGKRADAAVIDASQHEKRREADDHPRALPLRVIERGLLLRVGERNARARHHHESRRAEQDGGEQQQPVRLRPHFVHWCALRAPGSDGAHAANRFRTSSLNWLPRSSKSLNMSKLLYAGLKRETQPARARLAAMEVASSSVCARMTFGWALSALASSSAEAPIKITASVLARTSVTQSPRSQPLP